MLTESCIPYSIYFLMLTISSFYFFRNLFFLLFVLPLLITSKNASSTTLWLKNCGTKIDPSHFSRSLNFYVRISKFIFTIYLDQ